MTITEPISREDVGATDPLALDPLSPIAPRPATRAPAAPLALDALGPVSLRPDER